MRPIAGWFLRLTGAVCLAWLLTVAGRSAPLAARGEAPTEPRLETRDAPSAPVPALAGARPLTLRGRTADELAREFDHFGAKSTALAQGDFDEDGIADLVAAYAVPGGGVLTVLRGNPQSIYGDRSHSGGAVVAPFLDPERTFALGVSPELVGSGDFDADGHQDVVFAQHDDQRLYFLPGEGNGSFGPIEELGVPGRITAMVAGEVNRPDGLADVIVGLDGPAGPRVLVLEGPEGARRAGPETVSLPDVATSLALGQFDGRSPVDLAVAAGHELLLLYGRDRRLSHDDLRQAQVGPPPIERIAESSSIIVAVAAGDFVPGGRRQQVAALSQDGTLQLFGWDERPLDVGQSPASWQRWSEDRVTGPMDEEDAGEARLFAGRVFGGRSPELILLHADERRLDVLLPRVGEAPAETDPPATLEVEWVGPARETLAQEPIALLPMRLNADAQADLVVLLRDDPAPWLMPSAPAATFTVTNADPDGSGSLRQAILDANNSGGADLIQFAIPGEGPFEISPIEALPPITGAVTLDGYTQPGATPNTVPAPGGSSATLNVTLRGSLAGLGVDGLTLAGSGIVVRGLVIRDFDRYGIRVLASGNLIEGNYIGTEETGTLGEANGDDGIRIEDASNTTIGGTAPAARNLISANNSDGIEIIGLLTTTDILIQGNFIGTEVLGLFELGNASDGVQTEDAVVVVGGTTAGAGNVISGNGQDGVDIEDSDLTLIQGNSIGLGADGSQNIGNDEAGVRIDGPVVTVGGTGVGAGNVISANLGSGVLIISIDATSNLVQGNRIGTTANGLTGRGNGFSGVVIDKAPGNLVGGTVSGAANVISANQSAGVFIQSAESNANQVQGNLIGCDVNGTGALGNAGNGVVIASASNNLVGGTQPGAGNVISGNLGRGVRLTSSSSSGNSVQGNLIGTDITGQASLGNMLEGIQLFLAVDNLIGGSTSGAGNVISANGGPGVGVSFAGTSSNRLEGNWIGTDASGNPSLGNAGAGVLISGGSNNSVGGTEAGQANVIAGNSGEGVRVEVGTGNAVLTNSIFLNGLLGIDLGPAGVAPNDVGDPDAGANNLQNFPTLESAALPSPDVLSVSGTLDSTPATSFRLEFFANTVCDSSGHGEGRTLLGVADVITDATGIATFDASLPYPMGGGEAITATATSADGDTSEFSGCVTPSCGFSEVFGQAMVALDAETMSWPAPADVRIAKGELAQLSSYGIFQGGLLLGATSFDITESAPVGTGFFYLVRPSLCGSWQTEAEPSPLGTRRFPSGLDFAPGCAQRGGDLQLQKGEQKRVDYRGVDEPGDLMKLLLLVVVAVAAGVALAPPLKGVSPDPVKRLRKLLSGLPLKDTETRFCGIWQQGSLDGERIAFQVDEATLVLFVGDFNPHSKLNGGCFFGRASSPRSRPGSGGNPGGRSLLDSSMPELVSRYFPWSEASVNHPALADTVVRKALLELSPAMVNVGFHPPRGVQIELELARVTPRTLAADARWAVTMVRALRAGDVPEVDQGRSRSAV